MNSILLDKEYWKYVLREGLPLIKVRCPKCNEWGDLIDHTISEDGLIDPSVVCGMTGCDFHAMVGLKDFKRKE